jgi:hypothetical protein
LSKNQHSSGLKKTATGGVAAVACPKPGEHHQGGFKSAKLSKNILRLTGRTAADDGFKL